MNIKDFGHVAFRCGDLAASLAFYEGVLGLRRAFTLTYGELRGDRLSPDADKPWIIYLKITDTVFIELFDPAAATGAGLPDDAHFGYQHLALLVPDIIAARDELIAHGAPVDVQPRRGLDHTWQMWSHDPDGNKIEFMQYTSESYQLVGHGA